MDLSFQNCEHYIFVMCKLSRTRYFVIAAGRDIVQPEDAICQDRGPSIGKGTWQELRTHTGTVVNDDALVPKHINCHKC